MSLLDSFSLIFLVAVVVINAFLAIFVYRANRASATHRIFLILCLLMSIWVFDMIIALNPRFVSMGLWLSRLSFFIATPMDIAFFLFAKTVPENTIGVRSKTLVGLCMLGLLVMILAASPYTFSTLTLINGSPQVLPGPALPFVGGFNSILVLSAMLVLAKRSHRAIGAQKIQLRLIMNGIMLMFGLVIFTIFLPILFFNFSGFVSFAPIYTLFFLGVTAYAIVKFHLFELKVVATEAFTVLLWVSFLSRIIVATSTTDRVVSIAIFGATVVFGILLIRSVRAEVRQREQLEVLTKELAGLNEQLKALDKARAEFISIASHQLRTPPATIKWYLAGVLGGDFGPVSAKVKKALFRTQSTNSSMISLIDDLLNASRIERGKMEFLFEPIDIQKLVEITIDQLAPQAEDKKLKLAFVKPKKKVPILTADREKIRQVINNFIDNAIKYTKQGSVTALLEVTEKDVLFKVTDTGKGIDSTLTQNIFGKYSRGHDAATHATGLGLGLYVAKAIVEQHKGKIWAESPGEGKGSTFIFSLPIKSDLKASGSWDMTQKKPDLK